MLGLYKKDTSTTHTQYLVWYVQLYETLESVTSSYRHHDGAPPHIKLHVYNQTISRNMHAARLPTKTVHNNLTPRDAPELSCRPWFRGRWPSPSKAARGRGSWPTIPCLAPLPARAKRTCASKCISLHQNASFSGAQKQQNEKKNDSGWTSPSVVRKCDSLDVVPLYFEWNCVKLAVIGRGVYRGRTTKVPVGRWSIMCRNYH